MGHPTISLNRFCVFFLGLLLLTLGLSLFPSYTKVSAAEQFQSSDEAVRLGVVIAPGAVLKVRMTYTAGKFTIDSADLQKGYAPKQNEFAKEYALVGKDATGRELTKKFFVVPSHIGAPPPLSGQAASPGKAVTTVKLSEMIPWSAQYKTIEVQDKGGKVLASFDSAKIVEKNNVVSFGVKKGSDFSKKTTEVQSQNHVLGASTGTLNITFIGDGYATDEMTLFHDDVVRFAQKLATFTPFTQYLDHIVFYYVNNTSNLGCYYSGNFLICNTSLAESIVQSSGAPHDRIVVLVKSGAYGGSEGVIPVVYNGADGPQLFVHEFGHSLSELADEYIRNDATQRLDRNCFRGNPPNPQWNGFVNIGDYFVGCNFPNDYRSSQDSIMVNVGTSYFNAASIYYLKNSLDYYSGVVPTATGAVTPTGSNIPGDANGDGKVDGIDFVAWLSHYNQTTTNGPSWGDYNRDGKVDGIDYTVWLFNYR